MSYDFKINLIDHTAAVKSAVNSNIRKALSLMGEVVEGHAKEYCPEDTGLLRNSITHATGGGQTKITSYHADRPDKNGVVQSGAYPTAITGDTSTEYIGTNVKYAAKQEFGDYNHTVGQAHYLRDGAQNHIAELQDVAKKTLGAI